MKTVNVKRNYNNCTEAPEYWTGLKSVCPYDKTDKYRRLRRP